MGKEKRTEIYEMRLYRKDEGFEGTASCRQGSRVEGMVNSGTIHGLAREAARLWEPRGKDVSYVTIASSSFDVKNNMACDPMTGREMKQFNYWYFKYLEREK